MSLLAGMAIALSAATPAFATTTTLSGNPMTTTALSEVTSSPAAMVKAVDLRQQVEPGQFTRTEEGTFETAWRDTPFPFDELIYHWKAPLERGEGFRIYLQVKFGQGDESPWLYAGYWGRVKPAALGGEERPEPKFDHGKLAYDQLLLKKDAQAWRFRVVSEGQRPLATLPALGVIVTDNSPNEALLAEYGKKPEAVPAARVLDLPLRDQVDIAGNRFPDRCQSAALATAMQYFGTTVPLEQIIAHTTDPEYKAYGIWPRTLGAAHEFGFEAYLDRFRDWDSVRRTLAENKVILCSITMPRKGNYLAPPYPSMGGHIVALNGITDDGRVIVTDSALAAKNSEEQGNGGYMLQWLRPDFEQIWMRNKGGVGMVICPPKGAPENLVSEIPPFPDRSKKEEKEPEASAASGGN